MATEIRGSLGGASLTPHVQLPRGAPPAVAGGCQPRWGGFLHLVTRKSLTTHHPGHRRPNSLQGIGPPSTTNAAQNR